ncbi:MAG TPA: plastocyanin/azurin family copper-binding protein [Gaiellaceae bacterium]|jgi:plastocyanin|nr:plastocyanin/azurin family copper-binding protein [Gaiellaceae bacterium]
MTKLKLPIGVALAALVAVLALVPIAVAHTQAATSTTVKVKATDFHFALSRRTAPHGVVIFKVTNKGHTKHDFKIAGKKTALIKPGSSATLKVTLKKGTYKYLCTVPGHAALGMKGSFKVT